MPFIARTISAQRACDVLQRMFTYFVSLCLARFCGTSFPLEGGLYERRRGSERARFNGHRDYSTMGRNFTLHCDENARIDRELARVQPSRI